MDLSGVDTSQLLNELLERAEKIGLDEHDIYTNTLYSAKLEELLEDLWMAWTDALFEVARGKILLEEMEKADV